MKILYRELWEKLPDNFISIEKNTYKNKESVNSYKFATPNLNLYKTAEKKIEYISKVLINQFDISDTVLFQAAVKKICSGSGSEYRKITTLHSSSLCVLLHFYSISEENPLFLKIEGKMCRFIMSTFEFKNKVISGAASPSNMDIVLFGRDEVNNTPVVLFIESKFAEYYYDVSTIENISEKYLDADYSKDLYVKNVIEKMGYKLSNIERNKEHKFKLSSKKVCYLKGIKQYISHYVGIRKLLDNIKNNNIEKVYSECDDKERIIIENIKDGAYIYLGEILFDHVIGKLKLNKASNIECAMDYKKRYTNLAKILNEKLSEDGLNDNFKIVLNDFSYDEINCVKEDKIVTFYYN